MKAMDLETLCCKCSRNFNTMPDATPANYQEWFALKKVRETAIQGPYSDVYVRGSDGRSHRDIPALECGSAPQPRLPKEGDPGDRE